MTDTITFDPVPQPFERMLTDPPPRCEGCYVVAERLAAERKLDIAAELHVERTQGGALTEAERQWHREAWMEQVERRYREEAGDAS